MCVPTHTNLYLDNFHRTPLAKCPSRPSDSYVLLEIDNATTATSHSPPQVRKRTSNDILKLALLFGSCLAVVCLLEGGTILPSRRSNNEMLNRINKLTHDLDSFDRLKKEIINDEVELQWDRQHMAELEEDIASMKDSFGRTTQTFLEEETDLAQKNEALGEALNNTSEERRRNRESNRRDEFARLSNQMAEAHSELDGEIGKHARLNDLLDGAAREMQEENIPVPRAALRGAS